jgi:hypothetical protein
LAKRRTLECPKTHVEREANKPIKHTLCKRDRTELLDPALKSSQICCKYCIYFLHRVNPIILWTQGETVPILQLQPALVRVKHMPYTYGPELGWAPVCTLAGALVVLDDPQCFG